MGCATSMVKFLLFLFNFIFVVGGIFLVTFGALSYNGIKTIDEFVKTGTFQAPPIAMMVVGTIVVMIAFMGCCGVLKESKCMMMTYATLLLVLLIAEIAIAVGIHLYKDEFKNLLNDGMRESIKDYDTHPEIKEAWDTAQQNLKCCGVTSYNDWKSEGKDIPTSCCIEPKDGCVQPNIFQISSLIAGSSIYTDGCLEKAFADLKTDYGMYSAAIIAAIKMLGVFFGCCLGARFGRKNYST